MTTIVCTYNPNRVPAPKAALRFWALALAFGLAGIFFGGCVKRELEKPSEQGRLEISLEWMPGVVAERTEWSFYTEQGELYRREETDASGYKGSFPAGKYRMIARSVGADGVDFQMMDRYETAEVCAQRYDPSVEGIKSLLREPENVFVANRCDRFELLDVVAGDTLRGTAVMNSLTRMVKFRFGFEQMEVSSVKGILSGIARSVMLNTGDSPERVPGTVGFLASPVAAEEAAISYDSAANGKTFGGTVRGAEHQAVISVFNVRTKSGDSPEGTNVLDVLVTDADNKTYRASADVTKAIAQVVEENGGTAPAQIPLEVSLKLTDIGLTAVVTPWDESGTGGGNPRTIALPLRDAANNGINVPRP